MRRVVITGLGLVTPLGKDLKSSWANLIASKSGIVKIPDSLFDTQDLSTKIAGLVPDENSPNGLKLEDYISGKDLKKMDRFIHLGIAAAVQAVEDSGWQAITESQQERTGVLIGSGIGGLSSINDTAIILHEKGPKRVSPFFIPSALINLVSGHVSIKYNFKGPVHAVVTACSTGAHAIGDAANIIRNGYADVMIAGGAEAAVCRLGVAGFNACRALSTAFNDEPHKASRPWDKARDGFVMGEGSGILVLEEYEHAKARGAKIYAEVIGYGLSGDAYHITSPSPNGDGGYRSMKMAINMAKINPEQLDYINAHGTSTPVGDVIELQSVKNLYGNQKDKICMSSTKSAIGHLLGAAGSVEAIFSILAMKDGVVPPTLNLDDPSEECDIDLVPHTAREKKVNFVLSNSFGFGGTNASLVLAKI